MNALNVLSAMSGEQRALDCIGKHWKALESIGKEWKGVESVSACLTLRSIEFYKFLSGIVEFFVNFLLSSGRLLLCGALLELYFDIYCHYGQHINQLC